MTSEHSFSWLRIDPEHTRIFQLDLEHMTYHVRSEIYEWMFDQGWRRKDHFDYGIRLSPGAKLIMHEVYIDFKDASLAAIFKLRWL